MIVILMITRKKKITRLWIQILEKKLVTIIIIFISTIVVTVFATVLYVYIDHVTSKDFEYSCKQKQYHTNT